MAKLVLSSDGTVLNSYFIEREPMTIGRGADNDVVIDDPGVAGRHAVIITVGEDQIIEDMGSPAGTFVNGARIARQILQHRDIVEFGAFNLCYLNSRAAAQPDFDRTMIIAALPRQVGNAAPATPPANDAAPAARAVKVRFPSGRILRQVSSGTPEVVELNRVVTLVGTAGKQLAVITRRPQGYFVTHVEGRRHAHLNRRPIGDGPHALCHGDVIEVVGERFEFQLDGVAA